MVVSDDNTINCEISDNYSVDNPKTSDDDYSSTRCSAAVLSVVFLYFVMLFKFARTPKKKFDL